MTAAEREVPLYPVWAYSALEQRQWLEDHGEEFDYEPDPDADVDPEVDE